MSLNASLEQDQEEKNRVLSDIKKLQNQILISDKVEPFFKKFDKRRTQARINTMAAFPQKVVVAELQKSENGGGNLINQLYDRLSKKLENAREFVRTSEVAK